MTDDRRERAIEIAREYLDHIDMAAIKDTFPKVIAAIMEGMEARPPRELTEALRELIACEDAENAIIGTDKWEDEGADVVERFSRAWKRARTAIDAAPTDSNEPPADDATLLDRAKDYQWRSFVTRAEAQILVRDLADRIATLSARVQEQDEWDKPYIQRLEHENATLSAESYGLHKKLGEFNWTARRDKECTVQRQRAERAEAKLAAAEADRRDAERYRYITRNIVDVCNWHDAAYASPAAFDAHVDAAIAASKVLP